MTVTLGVSLAGRVGPVKVACWWPDDAGRTWTAAGRVTVYPRQEYDPPRVRLTGGVTRVDFHQHARDADGLPAPPAFDPATGWLSVVAEPPRVGRAEPGVLRWTTTLRLGARPESAPPAERAMAILHDREAAALLSVEYAVTPVATTYPARLAFLFAPGGPETLTQVIQVRGPGGLPPAVSAVRCDLAGVSVAVNESQLTVTAGATATAVVGSVRATAAGPAGPVTVTVPVSLAPRG